MKYKTVVSYIF
jgi:hypothetical protein